jgi:hypothetical protein
LNLVRVTVRSFTVRARVIVVVTKRIIGLRVVVFRLGVVVFRLGASWRARRRWGEESAAATVESSKSESGETGEPAAHPRIIKMIRSTIGHRKAGKSVRWRRDDNQHRRGNWASPSSSGASPAPDVGSPRCRRFLIHDVSIA